MLKEREIFLQLCVKGMEDRGVYGDERYKARLKKEIRAVDQQGDHEYFVKLYEKCKSEKLIFPKNENNLLIVWLLGLAPDFELEREPAFVVGECPDIDVDFIRPVRDYLKRVWAPQAFGREFICEIGTYGTSGIKGAILDMTRVHDQDIHEIQGITVKIKDKFADDEGNTQELAWRDALKIYPEFNAFCEKNPEIAAAAELLQDRNRTGGVHAGGLIISSVPIDGFVPLEVRMVNKENPNGVICSAWTEGLRAQDLQPVGLIKFDLLVINNLLQIAYACDLVKKRHGLEGICNLPGGWDWSDISYLNDPQSIEMANKADLKCIFQFDSEGIRKMVRRGGISSFDDLAAYSALYRPGPLNMGMDARYCKRKKWKEGDLEHGEAYSIHPLMEPILGNTYGVMIFQEQIMDLLRVVGNVPDMHTEKVRKAISKKKVAQFIKYKEMFVENGAKNLNVNPDFCVDLWDQIESFAEYGFNRSHAYAYTYISSRLLWLKAHYPLEFYTAILMCEGDTKKFREYKIDAKNHDVPIKPVHINRSKESFNIHGDEIYFGFSNIKGIGEGAAEKVVENQPYQSFQDFLDRFGYDAKVVKPLTSLGVFEEKQDRLTLLKFSEYYKEAQKKRRDRQKRFETSMDHKLEELKELLLTEIKIDDPDFDVMSDFNDDAEKKWQERFVGVMRTVDYKSKGEVKQKQVPFLKLLMDMSRKRASSIKNFWEKEKDADERPLTIDQFNPAVVDLKDEEVDVLTDQMEVDGTLTYPKAESKYYGFQWTHVLETSPDFQGFTIDKYMEQVEEGFLVPVEVQVKKVEARKSKPKDPNKQPTEFWTITVEDADGRIMKLNIWKEDYTRFREELVEGNLVRIRVNPPSGGFSTFTFKSYPRNEKKPPKDEDDRLMVLRLPEKVKAAETNLDDFQFDASAIEGLLDLG